MQLCSLPLLRRAQRPRLLALREPQRQAYIGLKQSVSPKQRPCSAAYWVCFPAALSPDTRQLQR